MKITAVKAVPFTFWHDREPLSYCLVRVDTDSGLRGWGESCDSFGCTYARVIEQAVNDAFAPLLVGEELDSAQRLVHKARSWTRRRLGHQWVAAQALSGVEIALWDLLARVEAIPVAELLSGPGGPVPGGLDGPLPGGPVPVYASSVFLEEGDAAWHVALLDPLLSAGVRSVKLRIGVDWERDLETLSEIRDRLGPSVELMIDGNENFTVTTALDLSRRLATMAVGWLEEPVPQAATAAIEQVTHGSAVPIAYGEHMFSAVEFADATRRGLAQVLQPDVATCGGFAEGMEIAGAATTVGVRVVPHTAAGPVALAANLHFAAAAPGIELLEYPYPLAECWATIAPNCPIGVDHLVGGALDPPPGPGLGVDIDLDAVHARPYEPPAPRSGPSTRFMGDV